ncbi:hypothetical protein [uncultured Ruegeria sp.]|uniref:hypothetical protein n=1 Tax=uncultured Ruegeria sp. TaxID=259304 RepID=UPI00263A0789|nr:hypothetical protein [uncultured Ruegeria sp.]
MIGTVADWITYAAERGTTVADDAASAAALVRASDYIQYNYLQHFAEDFDQSSEVLENATYEAANLELATPDFFSKTFTADQQKVLTEVKGIKWTAVGDASGVDAARPMSTKIHAMLEPYMLEGITRIATV